MGNKFDYIYTSDLARAFETANIIAENNVHHTDAPSEGGCQTVETNPLLRERTWGIFDMKPWKEISAAIMESGVSHSDFKPKGGECRLDVKKRVIEFLDQLKAMIVTKALLENPKHCGFNVLAVSHGGTIRALARYLFLDCACDMSLFGLDAVDEEERKTVLEEKYIPNASISQFELQIDSTSAKLISVQCKKYAECQHVQAYI